MPGPRDRGRDVHVGVLMLLYQMSQYGFGKIPPVTLAGIAIMSLMFTGMIQVPWSKEEACVSSNKVLKSREYSRVFISAFEHGDDMHLYYNMISFLVKGVSLERKLGSPYFAYLIVMFSNLCSLMYIALANGMAAMFNQPFFLEQCAIGFSAVLFALKVLVNTYSVSQLVHLAPGVVVPASWAYWLELILIQIMVPNASFIGHLAGILVGLMFVRGPLKLAMDLPFIILTGRMSPDPRIETHEEIDEMDILMPDQAKRQREYRHRLQENLASSGRSGLKDPSMDAPPRPSVPATASGFQAPAPFWFGRPSYTYANGPSGRRDSQPSGSFWSQPDAAMDEALRRSRLEYEEQQALQEALARSRAEQESAQGSSSSVSPGYPLGQETQQPPQPSYGWNVNDDQPAPPPPARESLEEIRRRRLERFGTTVR